MSFTSIGDLSSGLRFRALDSRLQRQSRTLGVEMTTGKAMDVTKKVNGALDSVASLERSISLLKAYRQTGAEISTRGAAIQTALEKIQTRAGKLGGQMAIPLGPATPTSVSAGAGAALSGFREAIGTLNTQIAGEGLFSGRAVKRPAVKSADLILDDLQSLAAGAITASDVRAVVDTYFNDPAGGYMTGAYRGATQPAGAVRVSATQSVAFTVTAASPEVRNILKGMATAALLSRNTLSGATAARADLLRGAGNTLLSANTGLTVLRAGLGAQQERIDTIRAENAAQETKTRTLLSDLLSVDGYETATKFKATQTSLESLFLTTSRLSRLSLVNFIK